MLGTIRYIPLQSVDGRADESESFGHHARRGHADYRSSVKHDRSQGFLGAVTLAAPQRFPLRGAEFAPAYNQKTGTPENKK